MSWLGWVIFVVALLFSVMLHETGHFVAAKKFGMKVTQYFVGFGTTLWSFVRGETEYGIKVLPFGGFVKIVGMTSMDEVEPEDEPRSFRRHPAWQRLIVLFAGSFMHFVLALVLLFLVAGAIGLETSSNAAQVGSTIPCVKVTARVAASGACTGSGQVAGPARQAGLKAGDKIVSFDGKAVSTWTGLGHTIRSTPAGQSVPVVIDRNGHRLTLHVTLVKSAGQSELGIYGPVAFDRYNPIRAVT